MDKIIQPESLKAPNSDFDSLTLFLNIGDDVSSFLTNVFKTVNMDLLSPTGRFIINKVPAVIGELFNPKTIKIQLSSDGELIDSMGWQEAVNKGYTTEAIIIRQILNSCHSKLKVVCCDLFDILDTCDDNPNIKHTNKDDREFIVMMYEGLSLFLNSRDTMHKVSSIKINVAGKAKGIKRKVPKVEVDLDSPKEIDAFIEMVQAERVQYPEYSITTQLKEIVAEMRKL